MKKTKETLHQTARIILPEDIAFTAIEDVKPREFAVWIRALLQNWRQGTLGVKDRSEVSFSNKKPWKQKGTGRARAGSPRSPIWRKGGVSFGPQPRVRTLKVNKNLKKRVLNKLFGDLLTNKKVLSLVVNGELNKPSTSKAFHSLKNLGIEQNKVIVFVRPDDFITQASFVNIPTVAVLAFDQVNAFDVANVDNVIFLDRDLDLFKEMVSKWI